MPKTKTCPKLPLDHAPVDSFVPYITAAEIKEPVLEDPDKMAPPQQVALVVGGSRGIGRQIAIDLAKNNYSGTAS